MFRNYLKTSWRNIQRNKLFSFINILGLSIGIATCFIIMLYVKNELSYDKFNGNAENIARVIFKGNINGGKINESVSMPPVAQTMKNDFPEVQDATRILPYGISKITSNNQVFKDDRFAFVDPNFFSIFTFPMTEGNAKNALLQPNTLVITESTSKKYFGRENAVGKMLEVNIDGKSDVYKVTGVIKDMPANSHFHFDILGSMIGWKEATSDSWMYGGYHTYLLLKPGTSLQNLEARFPDMVARYMGPQIQQQMGLSLNEFRTKGNSLGFTLQPLLSIHLHSDTNNEFEPGGNATYVYVFGGVAIFMLIIACINFINLSTAGASKRAKEVGVRKVAGAGRFELIKQFLAESIMISLFALIIAFALVQSVLPAFKNLSGQHLNLSTQPFVAFIGLGLVVGIVAGLYPAFYLSSFQPIAVLKGKVRGHYKTFGLRSTLVVFQFFISVSLIIATVVVYQQMKYIRNKDLGFNKDQIITIPNSYALGKNEEVYKQEMLEDPRIVNGTSSYYKPAGPSSYNNALAHPKGNENLIVNGVDYHVDENYIPTLGMQMVSGRNFSRDFPTDSSAIILNETAARALGWNDGTAIGKTIIRQNSNRGNNYPYHVIGVVRNFNFKSLHEAISPLFMSLDPEGGLIFKIKTADITGLLATMKKNWDAFNTGEPFSYAFMDDLFNKTYATEQKTGTILNLFSILTIFVACLGLFGLATYIAEQRTKEIGVRKVLGASVQSIIYILSNDFLKLVFLSFLLAVPVTWWLMRSWLEDFAYRINIQWWVFALAGIVAALIALITISSQTIKAAISNPVKSLRTE